MGGKMKTLFGADLSGIESCVTSVVTGETWKRDAWEEFFRTGDPGKEPYCLIACKFYGVAAGSITKADKVRRNRGKVGDLAGNYGGWVGAWRKFDPDGELTDDQIADKLKIFRDMHPRTKKFWNLARLASVGAVRSPGRRKVCGPVSFEMLDGMLFLNLPSGRRMAYPEPRIVCNNRDDNEVACKRFSNDKGWHEARLWGGLLLENIVQAIARDVLFEGMLRLQDAGFKLVMHVHDEVVCESDDGNIDIDKFLELLTTRPTWMPDLPLAAKAWTGQRFDKVPPNNSSPVPESLVPQPYVIIRPDRNQKKYRTVSADPPWEWEARSKKGEGRSASQHYNTMKLDEIIAMGPEVEAVVADDCALFMWAINSMLPEALEVIKAWGFEYINLGFTWLKLDKHGKDLSDLKLGMGFWSRQQTEPCLFATRGHPRRLDKISHEESVRYWASRVQEVIIAPVREHSRKPDEAYDRIEKLVAGPRTEFFARQSRPGWDVLFSDEAELFDAGPVNTRQQKASLVKIESPPLIEIEKPKLIVPFTAPPPTEEPPAPQPAPIPKPESAPAPQAAPPKPEPAPAPTPSKPPPPPPPTASVPAENDEDNVFAVLKAQVYLPDFIGDTRAHCPFHDPDGTRSPSVQVYANGFKCFASDCGEFGDVFDWVEQVENVDREEAVDIVRKWQGEHHNSKSGTQIGAKRDAAGRQRAADLWRYARPLIGSLGEKYLTEDRGVDLSQLPDPHEVLRFHPYCPLGKSASGVIRYGPAIIALFRDALTDQACAIHRIGLMHDGHKLERQMLGKWPNARAVKLWRLLGPVLVICEGIETGLAAGTVRRIKPVWALGSASAIKTFPIIPGVRCLYILVDNDPAGRAAALACAQCWRAAGIKVVLLPPKELGLDANDVVKQQRVAHVAV
jgi:N6-adenosine-specific RNA methylase IME4